MIKLIAAAAVFLVASDPGSLLHDICIAIAMVTAVLGVVPGVTLIGYEYLRRSPSIAERSGAP